MALHLVRHGPPLVDPSIPRAEWRLAPEAPDAIGALRSAGVLPAGAAWFVSPEPTAIQTADLLGPDSYEVVEDLREQERAGGWVEDFDTAVIRALRDPALPAVLGWEPAADTQERVVAAVRKITVRAMLRGHDDVVLVGHGTAWTLLVAALTDAPPDTSAWQAMGLPDVCVIDGAEVASPWAAWRPGA